MTIDLEALQRLAFDALPVLLDSAVKGLVLLAVAGALVLAMRKASAAARQVVWLLALAALVALPLASAALPSWGVLPGWAKIEMAAEPVPANVADSTIVEPQADPLGGADRADMQAAPPAPRAHVAESGSPPAPTVALERDPQAMPAPAAAASTVKPAAGQSWRMWIVPSAVATWLVGTLVCLLPLLLGRLSLWRLARRCRRIDGGSWAMLLLRAAKAVGLRHGVQLLQSDAEPMPMVWGVLRPRLLLPAEAEDWSADRRWVVLLHELAHARRHDCLAKLIAHVACALYWFNPLCWIAFKLMQRESETACDDLVLSSGMGVPPMSLPAGQAGPTGVPVRDPEDSPVEEEVESITSAPIRPSDYAQHLLEIASGLKSPDVISGLAGYSSIAMARKSKLEGRLLAILDSTRNRRALTRFGILVAAALVAAVIIPLAAVGAGDSGPDSRELKAKEKRDFTALGPQFKALRQRWLATQPKSAGEMAGYNTVLHFDVDARRVVLREQGRDVQEVRLPEGYEWTLHLATPHGTRDIARQADLKIRHLRDQTNTCQEEFFLRGKLSDETGLWLSLKPNIGMGWGDGLLKLPVGDLTFRKSDVPAGRAVNESILVKAPATQPAAPAPPAPAAPDAVGPFLDAEAYISASSDSKRLVVFHGSSARVLDAVTGREVSRFGEVEDMPAISPDGRLVATSRGKILDAATGRQVAQTDLGNVGTAAQPQFSNDGRSLAFFTNKAVVIYDTATWKRKRTLPVPADELAGATMSGDGSTVAMALGVPSETVKKPPEWWANSITVWDAGTGRKVLASSRAGYHPTLSNDGKLLATGNEVVEVSTGKTVWKWTGQRGQKWTSNATLAISPAGDIVAVQSFEEEHSPEVVAENRRIELWNIRSGRFVGRLLGADYLRSFWFSGDGQLLLGSYGAVWDCTCVWRVSSATQPPPGEVSWGSDVDGVAVRLRPGKVVVEKGKPLALAADIRTTAKWKVPLAQWHCKLVVDDVTYLPIPRGDAKKPAWSAGEKDETITDIAVDMEPLWKSEQSPMRPLQLSPGKHTIRLAVRPAPVEKGLALKPAQVLSNPVEIEIIPADAKPTTQPDTNPGNSAVIDVHGGRVRIKSGDNTLEADKIVLESAAAPAAAARVSANVPAELAAKRDKLLAEADATIRKGIIELAERFPHLKRAGEREVLEGMPGNSVRVKKAKYWDALSLASPTGHISISFIHTDVKEKVASNSGPMPNEERVRVLIMVMPPPAEPGQLATFPLYPALGLVGQVGVGAGNAELDAALKKLVADALEPLKELDKKAGRGAPSAARGATSRASPPASAPIDPAIAWESKVGQTITLQGRAFRQKSGIISLRPADDACPYWVVELEHVLPDLRGGGEPLPVRVTGTLRLRKHTVSKEEVEQYKRDLAEGRKKQMQAASGAGDLEVGKIIRDYYIPDAVVTILPVATQPTPAGPATGPATAKSAMIWCPYGTGKLTFFEDVPLWSDQPGSSTLSLTGAAPASSWANIRFERKQGRILATLKSKGEPTWYPVRYVTVQLFNSKKSPLASDTQVLSTVESAVKSSHHVVDITLHFNLGEADKISDPAWYSVHSVSASSAEEGTAAKGTTQPTTRSPPAESGSASRAHNGASTQPATRPASQPATKLVDMVITPGVGVGPITLGMSKEDVIRHLGKPDKIEGEGGSGLNYISSMGLSVLVSRSKGVVSISCWTPGATYWLQGMFVKDFRGATDKGIKMGAGRDEIVRAYGKADSESGDASLLYMDYRSQGVQFMLRWGKLAKIDVVEPDVFALIPAKAFSQPAATTHPSTQPATQPGG